MDLEQIGIMLGKKTQELTHLVVNNYGNFY